MSREVYTIKDTAFNMFLQYLSPNGSPCWSKNWVYFFDTMEEAEAALKHILDTRGPLPLEVVTLKYKKEEPNDLQH